MAKLNFRYGAMNSGKSTALLQTAHNYEERGLTVAIVKPGQDTKGDDQVVSRIGDEVSRRVDILAGPDLDVRSAIQEMVAAQSLHATGVVLADEAQFFSRRQIEQLFKVAKLDDISVIAYGIRTSFQTELFEGSQRLFGLADSIEKLKTMCRCGDQAEFNGRFVDGVFVVSGDVVAIDGVGSTTYESLCGTCYLTAEAKALA